MRWSVMVAGGWTKGKGSRLRVREGDQEMDDWRMR